MSTAVVTGSVAAVANRTGQSIAQTFLSVELVAVIDVSGSMSSDDSRGGRSRYAVACEELAKLQAAEPGRIGIIAFSDAAHFVPGGVPPMIGGGTDLAGALTFAKIADGTGARFCVISDGWPDDAEAAIRVAKTYQSTISTIFVGPESDQAAQDFLKRLAVATGGAYQRDARVDGLADKLRPLLAAGVSA